MNKRLEVGLDILFFGGWPLTCFNFHNYLITVMVNLVAYQVFTSGY